MYALHDTVESNVHTRQQATQAGRLTALSSDDAMVNGVPLKAHSYWRWFAPGHDDACHDTMCQHMQS